MASQEIQDKVKCKLFAEWMPDKPGGLKGLINMAADAALAVLGERVEFLEGELQAALNHEAVDDNDDVCDCAPKDGELHIVDCPQFVASNPEPNSDSDDTNASRLLAETISKLPSQEPESVDQTKYRCPQCDVTHQRASDVGTRHAHLFYGGPAAVVHLEHCPVLEDAEAACNCNAIPASPTTRAQERRDP